MSEEQHKPTRLARALRATSIAAWLLAPLAWLLVEVRRRSLHADAAMSAQPVLIVVATSVLILVACNRRWRAAERLVLAGSCAALSLLTPVLFASIALGALVSSALSFPLALWAFDAAFARADASARESQRTRVLVVLSSIAFLLITHCTWSEIDFSFYGDATALVFAVAHFKRRQRMATRAALWASWFVAVFSDYAISLAGLLAIRLTCEEYPCGHITLVAAIPPLVMADSAPRFIVVVATGALSLLLTLREDEAERGAR